MRRNRYRYGLAVTMTENSLNFSRHAVHINFYDDYNEWFWLCSCGRIGSSEFEEVAEAEAREHIKEMEEAPTWNPPKMP